MLLAACLMVALALPWRAAWGQAVPEVIEIVHPGGAVTGPNFFALAVDALGNVYIGGASSNNVIRTSPRGDRVGTGGDRPCVTELFSSAAASALGFIFAGPKGIAVASNGTVYVVGTGGNQFQNNDNIVSIAPDGTIAELLNAEKAFTSTNRSDWNPGGIAIDENGGAGTFVYAAGPAGGGFVARVAPDGTGKEILNFGGQGVVLDEDGTLYVAGVNSKAVYQIPNARDGVCGEDGKDCPTLIADGQESMTPEENQLDCDGQRIRLNSPYALALAGGILYVTGQDSDNVLRRPLRPNNVLGLPMCTQQVLDANGGIPFDSPRAIAADDLGNIYAVGTRSDNVIWLQPDPADPSKVIPQQIIGHNNGLVSPQAAAVDAQRSFYVSGLITSNVFRIRTVTAGELCGNFKSDPGERCEYELDCCCSLTCEIPDGGTVCRDSGGDCDITDVCDGVRANCRDQRQGNDKVCREATKLCDVPEACDGGINCPDDKFLDAGTVCRSVNGICDVAESCTGSGPDCPPDGVLLKDTVCRPAVNSCDKVELCNGTSAFCDADVAQAPQTGCSLTSADIGMAETACLEDMGACDTAGQCRPVPIVGKSCVPSDMSAPDVLCIKSSSCDESGRCQVEARQDGEQCGNFCDNTACVAGQCVERQGPHPCGGSDLAHCDPLRLGRECVQCGDGILEPPEACDDGNQNSSDGCTERCELACDPANPQACAQPMLDDQVPDPCRATECLTVDLNPRNDTEGFACVTVTSGCTGCLSDRECSPGNSCEEARCEQNRCVGHDIVGSARATCAFADAFPGDGTQCAPTRDKNKAQTLASISKFEQSAQKLLESDVCSGGAVKPKAKVLRHVRHLLKRAVLRANALRTPFRGKITEECEGVLTARFARMLDNLDAAESSGWSCGGG